MTSVHNWYFLHIFFTYIFTNIYFLHMYCIWRHKWDLFCRMTLQMLTLTAWFYAKFPLRVISMIRLYFIGLGMKLIDWWLMIFDATSSLDPWQNWSQLKLASKNNFFTKKYEVQLRGKILFSAITIFVLLLFWIMHNPSIILYLFIMLKLFWPQYCSELPNHLPPTLLLTAVFLCGLYCVTAIKTVL